MKLLTYHLYSLKGAKSPPIIGLVYSCDLASCSFSSILFVKISAFKKAAKMWVDKKGEDNHQSHLWTIE